MTWFSVSIETSNMNSYHADRCNDQFEHALSSAWSTQADVGICAVDEKSIVVMLNRAACSMLGVDGLSLLNQPFKKLVSAVNFQVGVAQWLATPGFQGRRHATCENQGITVDLLFKSTTVRMANTTGGGEGGERFRIIAITDITELLSAQRHVNSETYRRQWQAPNAGVVISDARLPDMSIVYVNPMFEQMSGYKSSEVLGRNCRFLQGPKSKQPALAVIRTAIAIQANGYAQLRNYRKNGSVFINKLFISPVKDESGEVTHFVGIQHVQASVGALVAC